MEQNGGSSTANSIAKMGLLLSILTDQKNGVSTAKKSLGNNSFTTQTAIWKRNVAS